MRIPNDRTSVLRHQGLVGLTGLVLAASLLFGGATRSGFLSDVVLQLLAVPLLLIALWRLGTVPARPAWPLAFVLALILVPLVQLVPLPPQVWTRLPLRDLAAEALTLAGQDIGWRPLTLTPHATWLCLTSLVPPIAVFLATLLLSVRDRRRLVMLAIALGVVASFVGLLQVAQGPQGALKSIGLAGEGAATGFFANRNHFAALLYSLLLFTAAFVIAETKSLGPGSITSWKTRALVAVVVSFTVLVALLAAQIMARSRAGLGLTIVALFGVAALASSEERGSAGVGAKRLIASAVILVVIFASQFALWRALARFEADPLADARLAFARNTWDAAWTFMPLGSGLGSFVPVYQFFETPKDALVDTFANRAHNDVLEVWLEAGIVGLVLMALFFVWVMVRFWQTWRPSDHDRSHRERSSLDRLLMRAATLVIVLLLAHSLVDYPLRTTAMMAIFALACALLLEPLGPSAAAPERATADATRVSEPDINRLEVAPFSPWPEQAQTRPVSGTPQPTRPRPDGERLKTPVEGSRAARDRWAWPEPKDDTESVVPDASLAGALAPASPAGGAGDRLAQGQRWGAGMAWPEAWRRPSERQGGACKIEGDIQQSDEAKTEES